MSMQTTGCPSWCDGTHETHVHRGSVGEVEVPGGGCVFVVILQVAEGEPTMHISAAGVGLLGIDAMDHDDAASLMDALGHPALAALIRKAAAILAGS